MNSFPCSSCGQCCRVVGFMLSLREHMKPEDECYEEFISFPYEANEGICSQLQDDNTCGVFDNRPNLCKSEFMFEKYFSKRLTKNQYHFDLAANCNELIKMGKLPDKYLVKIENNV